MATYAGNLKRFNGTDWDILLPNPASHDTDYTDIVYPTYTKIGRAHV